MSTRLNKTHRYSDRRTVALCNRVITLTMMATDDGLKVTCTVCKIKGLKDKLVEAGYAIKSGTGNYNRIRVK